MKGHSISPSHISAKADRLIRPGRKDGGRIGSEDIAEDVVKEAKAKKIVGKVDGDEKKCHGGRAARKASR